jgi:hypothetical protein
MIKRLKYSYVSEHLRKEAMKIHQEEWSNFTMEQMNYTIEIDDITGIQKKIVSVSADGPKSLSKLLRIG